jgi:sugar lactone lactonase YvrE
MPTVLVFNPAQVGIAADSAQQLTASFRVSGYEGIFTPTASLNYGHDYSAGTVGCTPGDGFETCTVPITFQPTLPGARKDALLLMNGSAILATVLLGGIGQAPLALVQPGVITNPILSADYYIYNSTVDENGTVYFLSDNSNAVYSVTKAGVVTQLPITGLSSPHGIAIDGAGTLYIAQNNYGFDIVTYTAGGVQGTIPVQPPSPYVPCSNSNGGTLEYLYSTAFDMAGNLFTLEILCNQIFELQANGTYTTTTINPSMIQPSEIAVDPTSDVFVGGYDINELTFGGTQTQINTGGSPDGIAVDAAGTVYATRYDDSGGVAMLPASNYATALAALDPSAPPLGLSLGSDGTLYVGNYTQIDKVDRSQGAIAFGEQFVNTTSTAQDVGIYNGGNEPLTISNIALTGTGLAMQPTETNGCTNGVVLTSGSLCQVAVTLTPPNAGTFSGSLTFTTNSLNTTSTLQAVAISGFVYGVNVTPAPTSLTFGPQTTGTTSNPQTVTLTNNGNLYIGFLGAPTVPSGFNVNVPDSCGSLAAGASCQLSVTFSPTAVQTYSGTVTIPVSSSGGGSWPSVTFTVSGTGTPPAGPIASLSPNPVAFGSQIINTTSPAQTLTLSNTGNVTLAITGITIGGTNPGDFAVTTGANACGSMLAADSACYIYVTFTPASAASFSATLSVADDAIGSPQTASLTGTGTGFVSNVGTATAAQTVTVSFTAAGTLSSIQVLTLGAPNLDFTQASGGTCAAGTAYTAGQSCTVNVVFTPVYAGTRNGSVLLTDGSGNVLGTTYLPGTGLGPQIVYGPGIQTSPVTASQNYIPTGVAADGAGNLYFANSNFSGDSYGVFELPISASGYGPPVAIGSGYNNPLGVAVDGSGNLYVGDYANYRVVKIPWTGSGFGAQTTVPLDEQPFREPREVAVDSSGNVYFADYGYGTVVEVPWTGSGYGTLVTLPFTGLNSPNGVAVDGNGDVFCADSSNQRVVELPWTGSGYGDQVTVATLTSTEDPFFLVVDGTGDIYVTDQYGSGGGAVLEIPWTGSVYGAPVNLNVAGLGYAPYGVAVDGAGNVIVGGGVNGTVLRLDRADAPSLSFANTNVGSTSTDSPKTVTVLNIGNVSFYIVIPETGSNPVYPPNFPVNSADNNLCAEDNSYSESASCDISVNFTPTVAGALTGNVVLTDNNQNGVNVTQSIPVSGTGTAPAAPIASFSPSILGFPNTTVSASSTLTITLSNPGTANLAVSAVTLGGTNPSDFAKSADTCTGATVAPNSSCTVSVTFTPSATGLRSATVSFADNASNSPQSVTLSGTGTSAIPVAGVSPSSLTFSSQTQGTTSGSQPVTLSNTGSGGLTISSIAASANFAQTNTCAGSVAAGGSCTIYVTFTPTTTGPLTGTLTITDNSGGVVGSPQTVTLSGTGTSGPPIATLAPTALSYQHNLNLQCPSKPVILSNPGGSPLQISSIVAAGSFAISANACGTTLAPGANCEIDVSFTAESPVGVYSGTLTVSDNAAGSPQVVPLSGQVFPPCFLHSEAVTQQVLRSTPSTTFDLSDKLPSCHTTTIAMACANNQPATCAFSPAAISPGGSTVLTVQNLNALSTDTLSFTATGTDSTNTSSVNLLVLLSDFAFTPYPTTATVSAGQTASYALTLTPVNGLAGTIHLTCQGAPSGSTCTVTPSAVTLAANYPAQVSVAVSTSGGATGAPRGGAPWAGPGASLRLGMELASLLVLMGLAGWAVAGGRRAGGPGRSLAYRRLRLSGLVLAALALMLMACVACGGGGGMGNSVANPATPAGTYPLTVTGTYDASSGQATGLTHNQALTLQVH